MAKNQPTDTPKLLSQGLKDLFLASVAEKLSLLSSSRAQARHSSPEACLVSLPNPTARE